MGLPWKRYLMGADVALFSGAIHVVVSKNQINGKCSASVSLNSGDCGCLFICQDSASVDEAIESAEIWVELHCHKILDLLMCSGDEK